VAGSTYSASGHAGCECVVAVEQQWAVVTLGTCSESGGGHAAGCECVVAVEQQWAVVTFGTYSESGGGHAAGCECIVRHGVMRE